MSRAVIDASVLVKLFINEQGSRAAATAVKRAEALLAPDLLWAETGSVLWKYVRRGELADVAASQILADMLQMPIRITASRELVDAALPIAVETGRTVYDCLYIALAAQATAVLLTADERLANATHSTRWGKLIRAVR